MGGPASAPNADDGHLRITYDEIHVTIGQTARQIKEQFECVWQHVRRSRPALTLLETARISWLRSEVVGESSGGVLKSESSTANC